MISVSVIICTRKPREDFLRRVLAALRAQTLPTDQWELLLVSVAGDGPLSDRFDLSWHPHGRCILEEEAGKTHALLRAIAESQGELLVLVDDDNALRSDFLQATLKISAEYPFLGAWGGSCLPEFEVPPPAELAPWLKGLAIEKLETSYWAKLPRGGEALPLGAGMVVRRKLALHYRELTLHDPVRQALSPSDQPGHGGENSDMALCAFELGLGTGRFPELELTHLIPARKLDLPYFETLYGACGYSGVILERIHRHDELHPGQIPASRLRFWLVYAFLLVSGKSRVERRIRIAMEKGKLRAIQDLNRLEPAANAPS